MRGAVSESGGNASLAGERRQVWRRLNGHEGESRRQPRRTPGATFLRYSGGQGVHCEVGSEGHEEKYRAVIEGATLTMNRSAKGGARSSLHYGGEGVLIHPPHQGVCGRHGTEEQRVTSGGLVRSPGGAGGSEPISETRSGEQCRASSRTTARYLKHGESRVTESSAAEWAGEGGRRRWLGKDRKPESKGEEEDQFHE